MNPVAGLPAGPFACIVADPPWPLKIGKTRTTRGEVKPGKWNDPRQDNKEIADLAYPVLSVEDIAAMPVRDIAAADAHLYLWTNNQFLEAGYAVARAWGFKPVTLLVWAKNPTGLGLGGTFVNATEFCIFAFCIFARRGNLKANTRVDRTWWNWKRGRHSATPEAFQDIVEQVSPGPRVELFARRVRPGWTAWGNEVKR